MRRAGGAVLLVALVLMLNGDEAAQATPEIAKLPSVAATVQGSDSTPTAKLLHSEKQFKELQSRIETARHEFLSLSQAISPAKMHSSNLERLHQHRDKLGSLLEHAAVLTTQAAQSSVLLQTNAGTNTQMNSAAVWRRRRRRRRSAPVKTGVCTNHPKSRRRMCDGRRRRGVQRGSCPGCSCLKCKKGEKVDCGSEHRPGGVCGSVKQRARQIEKEMLPVNQFTCSSSKEDKDDWIFWSNCPGTSDSVVARRRRTKKKAATKKSVASGSNAMGHTEELKESRPSSNPNAKKRKKKSEQKHSTGKSEVQLGEGLKVNTATEATSGGAARQQMTTSWGKRRRRRRRSARDIAIEKSKKEKAKKTKEKAQKREKSEKRKQNEKNQKRKEKSKKAAEKMTCSVCVKGKAVKGKAVPSFCIQLHPLGKKMSDTCKKDGTDRDKARWHKDGCESGDQVLHKGVKVSGGYWYASQVIPRTATVVKGRWKLQSAGPIKNLGEGLAPSVPSLRRGPSQAPAAATPPGQASPAKPSAQASVPKSSKPLGEGAAGWWRRRRRTKQVSEKQRVKDEWRNSEDRRTMTATLAQGGDKGSSCTMAMVHAVTSIPLNSASPDADEKFRQLGEGFLFGKDSEDAKKKINPSQTRIHVEYVKVDVCKSMPRHSRFIASLKKTTKAKTKRAKRINTHISKKRKSMGLSNWQDEGQRMVCSVKKLILRTKLCISREVEEHRASGRKGKWNTVVKETKDDCQLIRMDDEESAELGEKEASHSTGKSEVQLGEGLKVNTATEATSGGAARQKITTSYWRRRRRRRSPRDIAIEKSKKEKAQKREKSKKEKAQKRKAKIARCETESSEFGLWSEVGEGPKTWGRRGTTRQQPAQSTVQHGATDSKNQLGGGRVMSWRRRRRRSKEARETYNIDKAREDTKVKNLPCFAKLFGLDAQVIAAMIV